MTSPVTQITRATRPRTLDVARVGEGRGFSPLPSFPAFCRVPDCRSPAWLAGFLMDTFQAVADAAGGW